MPASNEWEFQLPYISSSIWWGVSDVSHHNTRGVTAHCFTMFTSSHNRHHNQFRNILILPERKPVLLITPSPRLPGATSIGEPLTCFLFRSITCYPGHFVQLSSYDEWSFDWTLSTKLWKFMLQWVPVFDAFSWRNEIFIHQLTFGLFPTFWQLGIIPPWLCICRCTQHMLYHSLVYIPKSEILGQTVILCLTIWSTERLCSKPLDI